MGVHPPKRSALDVDARINHDTKGQAYPVDAVRETAYGVFYARPVHAHDRLRYQRSWVLPDVGLRVSAFTPQPGVRLDYDLYLDLIAADRPTPDAAERSWRWTDHYLDIIATTGTSATLLDADEFTQSIAEGQLSAGEAETTLEHAARALTGIAAHGYSVDDWLRSVGMPLTWPDPPF